MADKSRMVRPQELVAQVHALIEEKIQAEVNMVTAKDEMEKARQAYEFYINRVNDLVVQIATVYNLNTLDCEVPNPAIEQTAI